MSDSPIEQSLADKMHEAFMLSMELAYKNLTPHNTFFQIRDADTFNEKDTDLIYCWADGGKHGYIEKMISGRCSLQAKIDFDICEFEKSVDENIAYFKELLKTVPPIQKLTNAQMREMGYNY